MFKHVLIFNFFQCQKLWKNFCHPTFCCPIFCHPNSPVVLFYILSLFNCGENLTFLQWLNSQNINLFTMHCFTSKIMVNYWPFHGKFQFATKKYHGEGQWQLQRRQNPTFRLDAQINLATTFLWQPVVNLKIKNKKYLFSHRSLMTKF